MGAHHNPLNTTLKTVGTHLGAAGGVMHTDDAPHPGYIAAGALIGHTVGSLKARYDAYKAAKKQGYGTTGKIGAAITSMAGLANPQGHKKK